MATNNTMYFDYMTTDIYMTNDKYVDLWHVVYYDKASTTTMHKLNS
jgi:hypothetical protein